MAVLVLEEKATALADACPSSVGVKRPWLTAYEGMNLIGGEPVSHTGQHLFDAAAHRTGEAPISKYRPRSRDVFVKDRDVQHDRASGGLKSKTTLE